MEPTQNAKHQQKRRRWRIQMLIKSPAFVLNKRMFLEENAKQYAFGLTFSAKYDFQNAKKSRFRTVPTTSFL